MNPAKKSLLPLATKPNHTPNGETAMTNLNELAKMTAPHSHPHVFAAGRPTVSEAFRLLAAGKLHDLMWGDQELTPALGNKRKAWQSCQGLFDVTTALLYSAIGPVQWPIAKGEAFTLTRHSGVQNQELLKLRGVFTRCKPKKIRFDCEDDVNDRPDLDVLEVIKLALGNPDITVATEMPERKIGPVCRKAEIAVPKNIRMIPHNWLNWHSAQLTNDELVTALEMMHMPVDRSTGVLSLEGRPWFIKSDGIWFGDRRVRPTVFISHNQPGNGFGAEACTPVQPAMALLAAVMHKAHLLGPLDASQRWYAQLEKAIVAELSWDSEAQAGPVESDRDWFLQNTYKAQFVYPALPFTCTKGIVEYPKKPIGFRPMPVGNAIIADWVYAHNLVHLHKGAFDQLLRADQLMVKMSWLPKDVALEVSKECLTNALGTDDEAVHARHITDNIGIAKDETLYEAAAARMVFLLSTKEAKITKRIALGYPNACPVFALEEENVSRLAATKKAYLKPGQTEAGQGFEARACFTPYFQLPAGIAAQVKPVNPLSLDSYRIERQFVLEGNMTPEVMFDPDFVKTEVLSETTKRVTWKRSPRIGKGETVVRVPFKTSKGDTAYFPVNADVSGELVDLLLIVTTVGKVKQVAIEINLLKVEREAKLRSNGTKAMDAPLPNGPDMPVFCSLNKTHPQYGALDAHYLIPADADKSEGLAEWKLETVAQTAGQVDAEGNLMFPVLHDLFLSVQDENGCVPPMAFATGRIKPLFEEFDRLFGQDIWLDFVDTRLTDASDSNFIQTTMDLLVAKDAAKAFKGTISAEMSFLAELDSEAAAFIGDVPVTVIAVGPYADTFTSIYCFYVDEQGRSRMLVRTYAFVGWEHAPVLTALKVESVSVAKSGSNVSMGLMAGTIAGANLAGDRDFAMALVAPSRKAGNEAVALYAMTRSASIRTITKEGAEEYLPVVEVGPDTFDKAFVEAAVTEGRLLHALAEEYPKTVFKFTYKQKDKISSFTAWFPVLAGLGGTAFEQDENMATSLTVAIYRVAMGQALTSPAVISRLSRVKAQLTNLVASKGTLGGMLYGRKSAQSKTIATLGVPSGVMLVRHCQADEDCYDSSMYYELTKCQRAAGGLNDINGQKFMMWRPPLTAPCFLKVQVVRPGDELWHLVAFKPHTIVTSFWAAYVDRGDNDGDGRTFTPAFDSKLPITTYADLMRDLQECTGRDLGAMDTYIADHMMPKSRKETLQFGVSPKSIKSDFWMQNAMVSSTAFAGNFGLGHEVFFMTTVVNELLLNDKTVSERPRWLTPMMISVMAEIYETMLGGYDPDMAVIAGWLKTMVFEAKQPPGDVCALVEGIRDPSGTLVTSGLFAKAGLNAKVLAEVKDLSLMAGFSGKWQRKWEAKATSDAYPWLSKTETFTDEDSISSEQRAFGIAKLLHRLSKGECVAPALATRGTGHQVALWKKEVLDEYGYTAGFICPEPVEFQSVPDVVDVLDNFVSDPQDAYEDDCALAIDSFALPTHALRFMARFLPIHMQNLVAAIHLDATSKDEPMHIRREDPDAIEHLRNNSAFGCIFMNYVETAFIALMLGNLRYYDVEIDTFHIDPKCIEVPMVTTTHVLSDIYDYTAEADFQQLSNDQKDGVEAILDAADPQLPNSNVFLTGVPGRGKSHTLMVALRIVRKAFGEKVNIMVTGTSGTSAVNITNADFTARTLNSAFGLGASGSTLPAGLRDQPSNGRRGRRGTQSVASRLGRELSAGEVLLIVVDEASMGSSENYYLMSEVASLARKGRNIRFVFVGDLAQNPVVDKAGHPMQPGCNTNPWMDPTFMELGGRTLKRAGVFNNRMVLCELTEPHRSVDKKFVAHLDNISVAKITEDTAQYISQFIISKNRPMPEDALHIFPGNAAVQSMNEACAAKARAEGAKFMTARATVGGSSNNLSQYNNAYWLPSMSPMALVQEFFIGAPIQFRINDLEKGQFANGTTGTVVGFDQAKQEITVHLDHNDQIITVGRQAMLLEPDRDGNEPPTVLQIPAVLAAAMTGHKVQGQTIDRPIVVHVPYDLSKASINYAGWVYVAMSRIRDPKTQLFFEGNLSNILNSIEAGAQYRQEVAAFLTSLRNSQ